MLASIGAYVTNPEALPIRSALFDRTILAAIVSAGGNCTTESLLADVSPILAGESINEHEIAQSIGRLVADGACSIVNDKVFPTKVSLERLTATLAAVHAAVEGMRNAVFSAVLSQHKLTDAEKGRLTRNLKRSVASLLRKVGPTVSAAGDVVNELSINDGGITPILGQDLDPQVTQTALVALSEFSRDPQMKNCWQLLHARIRHYAFVISTHWAAVFRSKRYLDLYLFWILMHYWH